MINLLEPCLVPKMGISWLLLQAPKAPQLELQGDENCIQNVYI